MVQTLYYIISAVLIYYWFKMTLRTILMLE